MEDYPPLSPHLLCLMCMPSLPQLFPSAIIGIASIAVGAAVTRRGRPTAAGFPRTFPSRLLPPATFVQVTTPLMSRHPQLLLLLLPTSPPPIFVAIVVIATTGVSRRVAMMTSSFAIPTFFSRGEEGKKEKTLRQMTHGIHPPLPIVLPPRVLIPHYSTGDCVCCRKEDGASSPPFLSTGVFSQTERLYLPPLFRIRRSEQGGRSDLCWCNINEAYGTYILQ